MLYSVMRLRRAAFRAIKTLDQLPLKFLSTFDLDQGRIRSSGWRMLPWSGDRNGLNTQFGATSQAVNRGERQPAELLSKDEFVALGATRGEGGAVYVEVQIGSGGGGGGGTGKP